MPVALEIKVSVSSNKKYMVYYFDISLKASKVWRRNYQI